MLANAYGLRLLRQPAVRAIGLVVIVAVLVVARLGDLLGLDPGRLAYDFRAYWLAAGHLVHGEPIYQPYQLTGPYPPQAPGLFLYAPPLAALVVPFYLLSPSDVVPAALLWSGLGAVVAVLSLLALAREARLPERLSGLGLGRWAVVLVVVVAFALPEVIDELINGNVHLYLLGLFTLTWLAIRRGDLPGQRIAGLAIGAATVIKIFPAIVLLWFLLTGRRTAAGWTILGAVALSLVTLPIVGVQPWLDFPAVLANLSAPLDPSASYAPTLWLSPVLGFTLARVLVTASGLTIVAWSALRQDDRSSFAVTVLVSILITPALWSHYLSMILLPMGLAVGAGVPAVLIGLDYVLLSGEYQAAFGDLAWTVARLLPTLGEVLLLALLLRQWQPGAERGDLPARTQTAPT